MKELLNLEQFWPKRSINKKNVFKGNRGTFFILFDEFTIGSMA